MHVDSRELTELRIPVELRSRVGEILDIAGQACLTCLDPSHQPHASAGQLAESLGVAKSTMANKGASFKRRSTSASTLAPFRWRFGMRRAGVA